MKKLHALFVWNAVEDDGAKCQDDEAGLDKDEERRQQELLVFSAAYAAAANALHNKDVVDVVGHEEDGKHDEASKCRQRLCYYNIVCR